MRLAKTIGFLLFSFLIAWLLFEIACFGLFERLTGKKFDIASLQADRQNIIDIRTGAEKAGDLLYQLHPYVGYTGTPGKGPWGPGKPVYNKHGFIGGNWDAANAKTDDSFLVAITGGSVAESFAASADKHLNRWLKELHPAKQIEIQILNLAVAGYKQPQQLFAVQWALLNEHRIDAVVNIDGFNDMALAAENAEAGIAQLYPSGLHTASMEQLGQSAGRARTIRDRIDSKKLLNIQLLKFVNRAPFKYSPAFCFIAERYSTWTHVQILELHQKLQYTAIEKVPEYLRGVPQPHADAFAAAAKLWANSSIQLHKLCQAHGIQYIHVLQPNQYVPDSRNFAPGEKDTVYDPNSRWGNLFLKGLPHLRTEAKRLRALGVPFLNSTMVFKDIPERIYTDSCCHFNDHGNSYLAMPIARELSRSILGNSDIAKDKGQSKN